MTVADQLSTVVPPEPLPCPSWCAIEHREPPRLLGGMLLVPHEGAIGPDRSVLVKRRDEWFSHEAVRGESWNVWRLTPYLSVTGPDDESLIVFQSEIRQLLGFAPLMPKWMVTRIREAASLHGWVVE